MITGGRFAAATSGISLGTASQPLVTGVDVTGPEATGTGIDLANSTGAIVGQATVHGFAALCVDGPLREMPQEMRDPLLEVVLDVVHRGLVA